MESVYGYVSTLFSHSPEMAVFVALAIGFAVGKIPFGSFQLGGVAGSLLVAVGVSQFGVSVSDTVKNIFFALFIFAVGYDSGPQFFRSLGRKTLREVFLALVVAVSGLITVVLMAKVAGFDKGLAAGIAAGGLTQSAIMGVAGDAIAKLGLPADTVKTMTANIGVGYAVTYIFGTFGAIIICANILPKFMGQTMRDAAVAAEAEPGGQIVLGEGQSFALHKLIGRIYKLADNSFPTVAFLEDGSKEFPVTVEQVKRAGVLLPISPELKLQAGDIVLIVGQRNALVNLGGKLGKELSNESDMGMVMKTQEVIVTNTSCIDTSFATINDTMKSEIRHGVYVISAFRDGNPLSLDKEGNLMEGDVLKLYGAAEDMKRAVGYIGAPIIPSNKTDFVLMCLGLVVGLLIGMINIKIANIPLTLGSGGGVLLSGLLFSWYKSKHPLVAGTIPTSASQLLRDLGLAGFVTVVGLNSGLQAIATIKAQGLMIFFAGAVVTIVPLLIAMILGKYFLGYNNAAVFAGALTGSRSANPAFGQVLSMAGNSTPTVPFAITYALANVFLTLLGSLIVAFV